MALKIQSTAVPANARFNCVYRNRSVWKRRLSLLGLTALGLIALIASFAAWTVHDVSQHLPNVDSLADVRLNKATTILSEDGVTLATLETRYQRPISLADMAPYVIDATLAIEDERFYTHHGVDFRGVLRALWSNLRMGNAHGQGGSTLTQQLARNLYLTNEKTYRRKIAEMLLAQRIERKYSKQAILEAYLNTVYYGSGNYGIEAAARSYFGKSAKSLTLGEAALLAGIPQRPTAYAPTLHLRAALERRTSVLDRLRATGKITAGKQALAVATPLHILRPHTQNMNSWRAPYFVTEVMAALREKYGAEFVYSGVTVETSLNWQMQSAAERLLRTALHHGSESSANPNTGAIVCLDPRTGYVRALVGGPSFQHDQFDAATHGIRQPGSAFKPLLYAAAFDTGICNLLSTYKDAPSVYPSGEKDYVVHDYDEKYHGEMTVLDAIRHSINTIAVKVGQETGPGNVSAYAKRLGILTPLEPNLPLALGASAVHPLELCSTYTAFANGGDRYETAFITRLTSAAGRPLFHDTIADRHLPDTLKPRTVEQINVALREVVLNGTGIAAASVPDAHGKTGTTSSHRDAWFVGYNADLVTAIWVAHVHKARKAIAHSPARANAAYAAAQNSQQNVQQNDLETTYLPMGSATGGDLCAPLWASFMQEALPIQRKFNLEHGIAPSLVPAPALKDMLETLRTEAQQAARQAAAEKAGTGAGSDPALPKDFQPAENGSGPITVNVPDDVQDKRPDSQDKKQDKEDGMPSSPASAEEANDLPRNGDASETSGYTQSKLK